MIQFRICVIAVGIEVIDIRIKDFYFNGVTKEGLMEAFDTDEWLKHTKFALRLVRSVCSIPLSGQMLLYNPPSIVCAKNTSSLSGVFPY